MEGVLMRLTALAALATVGDMLAPEVARKGIRFIGGLLTACAMLELAAALGSWIG